MRFTRTRLLASAAAVLLAAFSTTVVASAAGSDPGPSQAAGNASRHHGQGHLIEHRTERFLEAFSARDLREVTATLDRDVTLVQPMTFSGNQEPDAVFQGKDEVAGYFEGVLTTMTRIDFVDQEINVSPQGRTAFVEADGNLRAADGRPYRNVYLFRIDWTADGRIEEIREYANPITFCQTFPENAVCAGS